MTNSPTAAEPKRKRRWYQYSLRTFFVMMTAVCIWLGWLTNQAHQQRAAVAWVEEMGGTVHYDYDFDEDGVPKADAEPPGPNWLRETLGVDFMADVVLIELSDDQVSDLTPLAGLTNLQGLYLSGTQVTDVTPLTGLKKPQVLSLSGTQVSDITSLAGLKNLQALDLEGTPVSEEQVTRLRWVLPKCRIWSSDQ